MNDEQDIVRVDVDSLDIPAGRYTTYDDCAAGRAIKLLKSWLSPEQLKDFEACNWFYVITKAGNRYRIDNGSVMNVKRLDPDGNVLEQLCWQPNIYPCFPGDAMLAQKLDLETDEEAALKVANHSGVTARWSGYGSAFSAAATLTILDNSFHAYTVTATVLDTRLIVA